MQLLHDVFLVNCAAAAAAGAGGFFRSGFKPAFKMKDFGDTTGSPAVVAAA
jgi:CDP-diglyceride synthetase